MRVSVYVTLKNGILDPQGQAVQKTLVGLGFSDVRDVRIGKYVQLEVDTDDEGDAIERVRAMCERLIANTVIEDYRVEAAGE